MKKILFIYLFLHTLLNADSNYELKLYETVIPSIITKQLIKVYLDKDAKILLKDSSKFKILNNCDESVDILIGKNFDDLSNECKNKPIFSTSYKSFKHTKNSFGAFYWRKGRPQIKFKGETIDKFKLHLPNSLERYRQ